MIIINIFQDQINALNHWIKKLGVTSGISDYLLVFIVVFIVAILSLLANFITKRFLLTAISHYVKKSKIWWDDIFLKRKLFNRLAHFAPALVIYFSSDLIAGHPEIIQLIKTIVGIYMIVLGISVFDALINGAHEIYLNLDVSKDRSIKGFIQIIKLVLYFIGGILILSVIFNKNPLYFLTGLSAMAAVLLLVFKDTILGFVASIQLTANNMVKLGDWITMPGHGADGNVIEITLNTVKVRNFDKTISTIPTYALVSESFSNWRGMKESGGRRIKRALHINVKSICFCTEEMLEKYEKIKLIADYIRQKRVEIEEDNKAKNLQKGDMLNGRRLTNIGVFRKYIESYIRNHPKIHGEGSLFIAMVRQLQQTEKGLPLEIYAFSKEQNWAVYEGIQADVFDHLMAVIPQFDLSLFQNPSGDDFRNLINSPNS